MEHMVYTSTYLDLGILHNTLRDDVSDSTVQWQTAHSSQQQSRLCVNQVQQIVKELLCPSQQAAQVIVPSLFENLCQR